MDLTRSVPYARAHWMMRALLVGAAVALTWPVRAQVTDVRRPGSLDMGPALRAMQADDAQNPGMLWVKGGVVAWEAAPASAAPSCASCHGPIDRMRGVAARHPTIDRTGPAPRVVTLAGRIQSCRTQRQGLPAFAREAPEWLRLETALANQSRGMPLKPPNDSDARALSKEGEAVYRQRIGQLDLSCAQCHDDRAGLKLGGAVIPQAHPTGYPVYRSEWQSVGSLQRRLRACMVGVRAQPFDAEDPAWARLELYLMRRAAGMTGDAPAVRP